MGFSGGSDSKNLPAMWETWVQFLGQENPLEKGRPVHSSKGPQLGRRTKFLNVKLK